MSVRRYATATFDDEKEGQPPIRFALLFLYADKKIATADARWFDMEGPFLYLDERSWLVAWEAEPEQKEEIKRRLLAVSGDLAWCPTLMPEVPAPSADHVEISVNCYQTLDSALAAFGL